MQNSYTKIYKSCWEKWKKNLNKWRQILCSWVGRFNIVKMTILSKLIYKFNVIPIKIQEVFFVQIEQLIIKCKGPKKSHNHFESEV